jgi:hypothetical protein
MKAEAIQKEYLNKMEVHTTRAKVSLGLNKMLGEKKVEHDGREWDLVLHEAVLAQAQYLGLNPRDDHDELLEFIELQRLLKDVEVEHVVETGRLAILVKVSLWFWWILACLPSQGSLEIRAWPMRSWRLLGSNTRRLLDPEHGKTCEGINHLLGGNKCTRSSPRGIPRGPIYRGG